MSNTSILEGIKAHSSKYSSNKHFVIKSKPNIKQSKQTIENDGPEQITANSKDIDLFLNYMKQRSSKFQQLLAQNAILNQEEFCQKHLFSSVCIRTILKAVFDKMLTQKRLGKNLKGMNKSNMEQIQKHIWSSLQREVALYQNERKYMWERDQLKKDLQNRKRQILKQLENVSLKYQDFQKQPNHHQKLGCLGFSQGGVNEGICSQRQIGFQNKSSGKSDGDLKMELTTKIEGISQTLIGQL